MADNFNLRAFLAENKLTKNAKLLKEEESQHTPEEELYYKIVEQLDIAGLTGEVTVALHSTHGMPEPEFQVMNADDAAWMIAEAAVEAEADVNDILFAQGDEIDQQGELDPETEGLECGLEIAIVDVGTYEIYQGSNKTEEDLNEARVVGFDVNKKAFKVSFVNKYGGGDFRILNAETPEQAEKVFTDIFINNPDYVKSIKSIEPYQVPAPKPQAPSQPGLEGVNYNSIRIDGVDSEDSPKFVDAYVTSAEFEDGTPLSEEELEQLTDELYQSGELADMAAQSMIDEAKKETWEEGAERLAKQSAALDRHIKRTTNENKMTNRDKYLTRLVENALGIQVNDSLDTEGYGDTNVNKKREKQGLPPAQGPKYSEAVTEDEMVEKEPLPKYESIEKLMQEIEHGTNKAMYEYKMNRMKEIAEMLEAKVTSLEEGEHADHIDQKAVKQMRKDIAALRKGEEKLRKEFDRKFNKKGKAAAPKAEVETEKPALQESKKLNTMEKQFDLRKFLVENKMTTNSRMMNEEEVGMTEIIVIVGGEQGGIDDVSTVTTPLSFEEYCQKKRVTDFNENRTMASADLDEETGIAYVDANSIDPQIKAILLDDDSESNDVYAALEEI